MFKKLFGSLTGGSPSPAPTEQGPYRDPSANLIYQLLFCDRPELFAKQADSGEPWSVIFAPAPDYTALEKLTMDEAT